MWYNSSGDVYMKSIFRKKILSVILIVLAVLSVCVIAAFIYFNPRFFPSTTINGSDVSYKTVDEVFSKLNDKTDDFKIVLKDKSKTFDISLKSIDGSLQMPKEKIEEVFRKRGSLFTFVSSGFNVNKDYKIPYDFKYNSKKFSRKIKSFSLNKGRVKPRSAYITKGDARFRLVPETKNSYLNLKLIKRDVVEIFETYTSGSAQVIDVNFSKYYKLPSVTADDLKSNFESLKSIIQNQIDLKVMSSNVSIDSKYLIDFINLKNNKFSSFDKNSIRSFVTRLSQKYDTVGKTQKFRTHTGKTIKVSGGTYGQSVNIDDTTDMLYTKLKRGDFSKCECKYSSSPLKTEGKHNNYNLGNTYVEISLSSQHMWFYKNGKLKVSTDVVTGNADGVHNTPTGVYTVFNKKSPAVLKGDNYTCPVSFWMALTYSGVGIHDSTWRGGYGGNIYQYDGSHGCINTPYSAVSKMYKNLEWNTPVVIY